MHHVYVLQSQKDLHLYVGYSTDIKTRIKAHNAGDVTSTKSRKPLSLIYYETYTNKGDALRREKYLKTTAGKKAIKYMLRCTLTENT